MRRFGQMWCWAVAATLAVACGGKSDSPGDGDAGTATGGDGDGDGDGPADIGQKEESCAELCEVAEACGTAIEDCTDSCSENESVSNSGQEAITECLNDISCEPTEAELAIAFLCVTEELEDIELSEDQETFCSDTSQRVQACTDSEPDTTLGDCESQIGLVSDELLGDINDCDQEDCEQLSGCIQRQILQGIDPTVFLGLGSSGDLSPGALADLLAVVTLGAQLPGLVDEGQNPFGGGGATQ